MKLRHGTVGFLVVAAVASLYAAHAEAQSARPLNPLVARSDRPRPAPAECEQGLAPAPALRVEVREIPIDDVRPVEEAVVHAPPSSALRAALQETQAALTRNDRPAFDAALARSRSLVATYPSGGERRAADEIVRLHEAAARLWDAQYRSPFFAEEDPEYAAVSSWPGYAEAVRRSVYTDERGRRFYPAGESRDFVTRLASERLQRGGISDARPATSTTRSTPTQTTSPRSTTTGSVWTPSTTPTPSRSSTTTSRPREVMQPGANMPRVKRNPVTTSPSTGTRSATRSTTNTTRSPKPAATTPAPGSPNPSAPPTATAAPAPAPAIVTDTDPVATSTPDAGDVPVDDVPAPATAAPSTTADASGDTPADSTIDSTIDTTVTTGSEVPVTAQPARGRSVILPTILILIGLGVLIVLFRASK